MTRWLHHQLLWTNINEYQLALSRQPIKFTYEPVTLLTVHVTMALDPLVSMIKHKVHEVSPGSSESYLAMPITPGRWRPLAEAGTVELVLGIVEMHSATSTTPQAL